MKLRYVVILLIAVFGLGIGAAYYFTPKTETPMWVKPGSVVKGPVDFDKNYDGDTFWIGKVKFRLWGIDAPEKQQECQRAGKPWDCGMASREALRLFIGRSTVSCEVKSRDYFPNRWDAICFIREVEINRWMVEQGWAYASVKYTKVYLPQEEKAKAKKLGIWTSTVQAPWEWRKSQKEK